MVFNSGFDNSLWLILASDKKYRFNIAEFIANERGINIIDLSEEINGNLSRIFDF